MHRIATLFARQLSSEIVTLDANSMPRHYQFMIKSFRDKATEFVARGHFSKRLPESIQRRAKMRLDRIAAATQIDDLRLPPSHQLEKMSGNRSGQHSIRIDRQWRICFVWHEGNACDVEIVDYH